MQVVEKKKCKDGKKNIMSEKYKTLPQGCSNKLARKSSNL